MRARTYRHATGRGLVEQCRSEHGRGLSTTVHRRSRRMTTVGSMRLGRRCQGRLAPMKKEIIMKRYSWVLACTAVMMALAVSTTLASQPAAGLGGQSRGREVAHMKFNDNDRQI